MDDIHLQLQAIAERNRRVEAEKAWEKSLTRRAFISLITYLTASLFLWFVGLSFSFISALVPTGGFLLSTLSLPWVKKWWARKVHAKRTSLR